MSLLTIGELRALVTTALSDPQLQAVIDREEAEIVRRYGAHYVDAGTLVTEMHPGGGRSLFLRRAIGSVTEVTERLNVSDSPQTLAATDYFAWADEGRLERLPAGTQWGAVVAVIYNPQDDSAKRKQVTVELVRLALERTALKSESVAGEYSYSAPEDWEAERARLIRSLGFWEV